MESGKDPETYAKKCVAISQKDSLLTKVIYQPWRYLLFRPLCHLIYTNESRDVPNDQLIIDAQARARRLGVAFPKLPLSHQHQAAIDYYLARQQARSGKSPVVAMQQADAALGECQRLQGDKDATCAGPQAPLSVLQAEQVRGEAQDAAERQALSRLAWLWSWPPLTTTSCRRWPRPGCESLACALKRQFRVPPELEAGMAALRPVLGRAPPGRAPRSPRLVSPHFAPALPATKASAPASPSPPARPWPLPPQATPTSAAAIADRADVEALAAPAAGGR